MINNNDRLLTSKYSFEWVNKNAEGTQKIDDLSWFSGQRLTQI